MRIIIGGTRSNVLVLGEPFDIPGGSEKFAVHRSLDADAIWKGEWSATHIETSFRVAAADDIDEAIAEARRVWMSKTPEELSAALHIARQVAAARRSGGIEQVAP